MTLPNRTEQENAGRNIPRRGRVKSALLSLVLAPPIAGFLLGLMALPVNFIYPLHPSIGFNEDLLAGAFAYTFGALFVGPPVALVALLIGWIFFPRGDVIPLGDVLLCVLLALLCGGVILAMLNGGFAKLSDLPAVAMIFIIVAIPVLASAALCWRITRRWHSPLPTLEPFS